MITGIQIRAARALLDWTQGDLATKAVVALRTIRLFEAGDRQPHQHTIDRLQGVLEQAGVRFIETDAGVGVLLMAET